MLPQTIGSRAFWGLIVFFVLLAGCRERQKQSIENETVESIQTIEVAEPEDLGVDSQILEDMEKAIISKDYPNIHSILIAKNGKLVYEQYFEGFDELWGDSLGLVQHSKERLHDVRSISKSIVSSCIGLAIEQGAIENVQQKVFDFFPEYAELRKAHKADLTLEHLLVMTSGLEWNEDVPYSDPENSEIKMTSSADPMEYILSRPLVSKPGEVWNYNGGTTQLLATIIEKTTRLPIDSFANQYLFQPLGIHEFEWTNFPGTEMPAAASGLRLRSRDLLKFGMLYAQEGAWNGKQLLSKDWVRKSTATHIKFGRNNNVGYGYQFWIFDGNTIQENHNNSIIAAVGNGDQRIYLDEQHELIVVVTAGNYNKWTIKKDSEALLGDFIYPSFLD